MILRCEELYQDLLDEIVLCRQKGLPFLLETEYCFHLAEKYHGMVRKELSVYHFPDQAEEIHFFRNIKPKFIAEIEYASLLNFAGNFCPSPSYVPDLVQFWMRQVNRLEKFKEKNKEFCDYYLSNETHLDYLHFTRLPPGDESYSFEKTRSNYDILVGQYLAREKYSAYAAHQLQSLEEKSNS